MKGFGGFVLFFLSLSLPFLVWFGLGQRRAGKPSHAMNQGQDKIIEVKTNDFWVQI